MALKNISKVYLLSVPLENDYKNTLYFTSKESQQSYFASKIVKSYDNFSYQRKDQTIRIPEEYDKIYHCNYVMYQNSAYSNKWFYCFIKEMKFISEGVTEVIIETDVMQTWAFDYTVKPSFVEREHVNDDTIGLHTIPEGLETGEYTLNGDIDIIDDFQLWSYIVNVSETSEGEDYACTMIGGVACAGAFFVYSYSEILELQSFIKTYDKRPDSIIQVYLVPSKLVEGNYDAETHQLKFNSSVTTVNKSISKPTTIDTYKPKNNKVLTFPYNYLLFSNNNGSSNVLHYEKFTGDNATFELKGIPTTGGSIKCYPINYKSSYHEEGLINGKFPICSWSNDLFTAWLTSNAVNIGVGMATSVIQGVAGIGLMATGAGAMAGGGMLASGVTGVVSSVGQIYQHTFVSPSAKGNTNGGDILTSTGLNSFLFYPMSIHKEYAEIIDEYFTMYGYKVNRVKTPNVAHRSRFWYTKTIDVNIDGLLPGDDLQKIKECYNRGITFWRNASEIQNYNLSNVIV